MLFTGIICLPYLLDFTVAGLKPFIQHKPLYVAYQQADGNLMLFRILVGPLLVVLTARLIGMEYSGGTIRVLLGRGVGRLQLLAAKLLTIGILATLLLVYGMLLNIALALITLKGVSGSFDLLKSLNSGFWSDMGLYVVTIAISMAVTILMAAAVTVMGRSLAVGMSVGLSFFAADNIGIVFFLLAHSLTGSDFWTFATGDLLGPNLNIMAQAILPVRPGLPRISRFTPPLVPVDGAHTLLVTALWSAAFLALMLVLTWKRDVKE